MTINLFGTLPTLLLIVLIPLLVYFVFWLLITGILGAFRMYSSLSWQATTGKLIRRELKYRNFSSTEGALTKQIITQKTYIYMVEGEVFKSDQTLALDSLFEKEYKPLTKSYIPKINIKTQNDYLGIEGTPITVYFNPKRPGKACLENRFETSILWQIFAGLVLGSMMLYFVFLYISPIQ